ncbi:MAG: class I SAM-dependent methyltransferase [Pseudomonadota bacterium]
MITDSLVKYYADIAQEYDRIYDKEERQDELDELHERVGELLDGHTVLEIACGTGYWTDTLAVAADAVLATDVNPAMLNVARARGLNADVVTFAEADAYDLPESVGQYTACFAGFWWSHVKREDQDRFLKQLRAKLGKDVLFVTIDNSFVEGNSTVIARTDLEGNTYQIRTSGKGERYEVLKNYPADSNLRKRFANHAREIRIERLEYYWLLSCRLK